MSKIFIDELKTSPNNNRMGVNAVFEISAGGGGEKSQNCDAALRWRNNSPDYISPKKIHKQVTYGLPIGRGEIPGCYYSIT